MKRLWVAVALAPLTFAASAYGQTCTGTPVVCTVSTSTTAPTATSSIDGGAASEIDFNAGIAPTLATPLPAAITIDATPAGGTVVRNAGTLTYTGVNGVSGIQANSGTAGEIINSGAIDITETTTGDTTVGGLVSGPFANGTGRIGIYIAGPGTHTGTADITNDPIDAVLNPTNTLNSTNLTAIDNSGAITILGENSAGIYATGNVGGNILNSGSISVTGGNSATSDVSYGILTTGQVQGNVTLTGAVAVAGQNAVGVALVGGVNGAVIVDSSILATGYRATINPGFTVAPVLAPDQVLQGGPALYIGGDVADGVNIEAPLAATSTAIAVVGGTVTSYGDAPAILIGAPTAGSTTLHSVAGTNADLVVGGTVTATGVYDSLATAQNATPTTQAYDATAIQIGGTNNLSVAIGGSDISGTGGVAPNSAFGTVTLPDGINIAGSVSASVLVTSSAPNVTSATGISIGQNASVGLLTVSGTLVANAQTSFTAAAPGSAKVTALDITGSLGSLNNLGAIAATVSPILADSKNVAVYQGGFSSTVPVAIKDSDTTGATLSITNRDSILAADINATTDLIAPSGVNALGTAMDFRGDTGVVNIVQDPFNGTLATGVTKVVPSITGNIYFGSNASNLDVEIGSVDGDVSYGASTNNTLVINNPNALALYDGVTVVKGALSEASGGLLAVTVGATGNADNTSALVMTAPTAINLSSLHVGSTGQITFAVTPGTTAAQFNVQGTTTLDTGAKINVAVTALPTGAAQTYTLISSTDAFSTTGVGSSVAGTTPYILSASFNAATRAVSDPLTVTIGERTGSQLSQLTAVERNAFDPFYDALAGDAATATAGSSDAAILADVLSKTNVSSFKKAYDQFLPDFAGGPFQTLEVGQEAVYRAESDAPLKLQTDERRGWVQEIGYLDHRDNSDSGGYTGNGFGFVGGLESTAGDGAVGVTAAYLTSNVQDTAQSANGHLAASVLEAGVYWRSGGTGLNFDASVNGGWAWFDSKRLFLDSGAPDAVTGATQSVSNTASSTWNGAVLAAHLGVKAPIVVGRVYLRPEASVDYYGLYEGGHSETGGVSALDLTVAARNSQEALAQADLVLGINYGEVIKWRPELTIGYRDVVEGGPAVTKANFTGGSTFTLAPTFNDKGGILARLGIRAGGSYADFSADAGGEYRNGSQTYDARALARFLF